MIRRLVLALLVAAAPGLAQAEQPIAFIAPTAPTADNGDRIATTAWVRNLIAAGLPLGAGQIWIGNASNIATAVAPPAAFDALAPTTTRGDLIYRNATSNTRLSAATLGYHLQTNGAGTDPTWAGFLQSGTGAVTRTWQAKARDFINAADFGVTADGTTDDTAALIAADTAAASLKKKLLLPGSFIRVTSAITPSAGAHWVGEGAQVTTLYIDSASATLFNISNADVIMEGFRVVPAVTRNNTAIYFNITAAGVTSVHHVDIAAAGIAFKFNAVAGQIWVDRVTLSSTILNGIDFSISDCFIGTISNVNSFASAGARPFAAIYADNIGGQLQIINSNFDQHNVGLYLAPAAGQVVTLVSAEQAFFDGNTTSFLIAPSSTGIVQRISVINSWISDFSTVGVNIIGGGSTTINQVTISDTNIIGTGATAVVASGGATGVILRGNHIQATTTGLSLTNVVGGQVTGNIVNAATTGIVLAGTSDKVSVQQNDFSAAATGLTNTSSGTANIIGPNTGYNPISVPPSLVQGDLIYGSAANGVTSRLAKDTNATRYLANTGTSNNPAWDQVDLTNGVKNTLPVAKGGSGLAAGVSGGVPYYSSTVSMGSSALLTLNGLVLGGGAGGSPSVTAAGTNGQIVVGQTSAAPTWNTMSGDCTLSAAGAITCTKVNGVTHPSSMTSGGVMYASSTSAVASSALLTANGIVLGGGAGAAPTSTAAGTNTQLLIGQTGAAPTWNTMSGDCTISAAGAITCTKINGVDQTAAYTPYTPTLSCNTGSLTTGTATGRYKQSGKTYFLQVAITITTVGTCSFLKFTLPNSITAAAQYVIVGKRNDNGVSILADSVSTNSTMLVNKYDSTDPLAAGATMTFSGVVEAQ